MGVRPHGVCVTLLPSGAYACMQHKHLHAPWAVACTMHHGTVLHTHIPPPSVPPAGLFRT
eukprot:91111-Chlamydomonas_euryale.AAC.3